MRYCNLYSYVNESNDDQNIEKCARVYVYLKCNLYVDNTIKYPIIMKFVEEKKKLLTTDFDR